MSEEPKIPKREAEINHRRNLTWQILLPIVVASIALLFVAILSISAAGQTPAVNEKWAQISTILLILPALLFGLIILALIILGAWLLGKLIKGIPPYTAYLAYIFDRTKGITSRIADNSAAPLIGVRSILAGFSRFLSLLLNHKTSDKE